MIKIAYIIIILTILLFAHLLEEIRTGFRKKILSGRLPLPVFALLNVAIYSYALITIILAFKNSPIAVLLAWIYGIAMLFNAAAHIGMMVLKRGYFPGGITALALLPVALYLLIEMSRLPT